jgi:hypothetical protein
MGESQEDRRTDEEHLSLNAEWFITKYGDEAYKKATLFATIAVNVGDKEGAEQAAAAARELLQRGYHKK